MGRAGARLPTLARLVKRSRLASRSPKRVAEAEAREALRVAVSRAHGDRCALAPTGRCRNVYGDPWRPQDALDPHEVVRRSQRPGSHLERNVVIPLCRWHHDQDRHLPEAQALGIRAPGWTVDQYGLDRVLAELARIRSEVNAGGLRSPAFWLDER